MSSQKEANVLYLTETGLCRNSGGVLCAAGVPECFQVYYDLAVPSYVKHGVSAQWLWKDVGQITVGVNNLFDKDPPTISDDNTTATPPRFGNFFANGGYDVRGRSFFINVTKSF